MQNEFLRIQSVQKKSVIFITHDFQEALRLADRMAIMRDGEIVQIGRPVDLILQPADNYVREFTYDVPWESVLSVADIATSDIDLKTGLPKVDGETPVASILPLLAKSDKGVLVTSSHGTVIGVANAKTFVEALASSSTEMHKG